MTVDTSESLPALEREELELDSTVTVPGPLQKAQYLFIKLRHKIKHLVQHSADKDACTE